MLKHFNCNYPIPHIFCILINIVRVRAIMRHLWCPARRRLCRSDGRPISILRSLRTVYVRLALIVRLCNTARHCAWSAEGATEARATARLNLLRLRAPGGSSTSTRREGTLAWELRPSAPVWARVALLSACECTSDTRCAPLLERKCLRLWGAVSGAQDAKA